MKRYVEELTDAVKAQLALAYGVKDLLGFGLRSRLKEGYTGADFRADALAGLVVGIVALPLSMALATAVDVPPQHGLYTAIVAGIIVALLGGTRAQVTGPTAAFVVILMPIVHEHGLGGLLVAGFLAGVILVLMGIARFGRFMSFIPHPVTTGFTAGIGLVIALLQLKDAFGVTPAGRPEGVVAYLDALWQARQSINGWDVSVAAVTLGMLLLIPKGVKRVPAPLIALAAAAVLAALCDHLVTDFHVATIGSKFHVELDGETIRGIPPLPPMPVWPWELGGADGGEFTLSFALVRELMPAAFAIAMLGAIESLMAAVIADGMMGTKHDPNSELIALGIANMVVPFFGGIAATGALARTATNIRAGARSPLSVVVHAFFILASTIALAPLVAYLPMAALAALLLIVAKNMSEARHFVRLMRIAPRSDVIVLLTCFTLTVLFDMVVAVSVGVMLAALLFMKRMSVLTRVTLDTTTAEKLEMPAGVRLYEIAGPMFFGAANVALATLERIGNDARVVILDMRAVPDIDATGLVALEGILDNLKRSQRKTILSGMQPAVAETFDRAGIKRIPGRLAFAPDVETAVSMAIVHEARGVLATPPTGTASLGPAH
ncbi:MAG TPA: C4-dicarboxylic acid transporter DauA [Kofleriaceae bacterium]|nr:C4-dicarboxylic acid transporter DauA [Kofleriaceae bacterium]